MLSKIYNIAVNVNQFQIQCPFCGLNQQILEIWKKHEYIKCEEFFSGQDGKKILAEISVAAEISTKNRFFVEYSAATEISAKLFLPKCPEKNCTHFMY